MRSEIPLNRTAASFLSSRNNIMALAEEYWELISVRDATEERLFKSSFQEARGNGYLSKELFVRVAR
jgi:hypothetical protein